MKSKLFIAKLSKGSIVQLLFLLAVLSFPFFGTDCKDDTIGGGTSGNLAGTWKLT